jgi:glycolate oxidase FAD binding subunit
MTLSELALDAPYPERATLGGIYATNTSGPRRFGAGRPRDLIIGVSFVTAAGKLVKGGGRVVKNVAGYDFPKLITGSMGTLGVLTQLTLKVRPRPESSALVAIPFTRPEDLAEWLTRLNTSGTRPLAVEVLNKLGAARIESAGNLPVGAWMLVLGYEDNLASVSWQLEQLTKELGPLGAGQVTFRDAEAAPLWGGLAEFQALEIGPLSFVANLPASACVAYAAALHQNRWAVQCHAGNGIVRAHLVAADGLETIGPEIDRLRADAVRLGGNLILSRCPTEWKPRLRVWGEPRGDWAIAEKIKQALDPDGVLNPGRFVGTI